MTTERSLAWAATMSGAPDAGGPRVAPVAPGALLDREAREDIEVGLLAPGATRARGAGRRAREEEPDAVPTAGLFLMGAAGAALAFRRRRVTS